MTKHMIKLVQILVPVLFVAIVPISRAEFEPSFVLGGGVRFGNEASVDRAVAGYALAKVNLLRFGDYHYISFLSPGVGVQTDGRFHVNISPILYSLNNGFSFGVDLIFPKNEAQNIFGLFVGYEF